MMHWLRCVMRHSQVLYFCSLITFLFAGDGRAATNFISGTVSTSTTWSGTNWLSGTVLITNGAVLTIEPGTLMLMNTNAVLLVQGAQLLANGASNAPVTFTRATAAARWEQLKFIRATNSVLRHCIFEYASSAGDHKDYYDNDCNTNTPPLTRNYHEAIVALATHLDVDGCTFRNLPDTAATAEGDALAIIADDPQNPGPASAHIRNSLFFEIGQGVHTRFSYVLVERCTFISHNGDNDDVDMYGESIPVPLIRSNIFLFAHDDFVNPTRCSAIIERNIFIGTNDTDHGIVLRDVCRPVVMNNVIYRCNTGAIAVQNGCDGLIANNTIVNCNSAIKLFDHSDRTNNPYCLAASSGKATLVNNIIWNSTPAFNMAGFAWSNLTVIVSFSDIQGGTNNSTRNAGAILINGPGNINVDPALLNVTGTNFHLTASSPCIDAGTNVLLAITNFSVAMTNDFDGIPRPLDGNGNGVAQFDMGAFEFLLASADSNADGIPDGWAQQFGFNPLASNVATNNADGDALNNLEEWIADTNPTNAASFFGIQNIGPAFPFAVQFLSSSNREYTLFYTTDFSGWTNVSAQTEVPGNGGLRSLTDSNAAPHKFYKIGVTVP
jgi:hypothetical protein